MLMKRICLGIAVISVVALWYQSAATRPAAAQSGTRSPSSQPSGGGTRVPQGNSAGNAGGMRSSAAHPPFEVRLQDYLKAMHYENWAPHSGTDGDFTAGQGPHGAFLKVYLNRMAASDPKSPPHGSILVKENYGPDKKTLMALTVMYRVKGFDPEHNDWYWVKYEPNGAASQMNGMSVAGRVKMCADCHSSADGNDFVFGND